MPRTLALGFEPFVLRFLRIALHSTVSRSSETASEVVGAVALFLLTATRALRRVVVVVAGASALSFLELKIAGRFSVS